MVVSDHQIVLYGDPVTVTDPRFNDMAGEFLPELCVPRGPQVDEWRRKRLQPSPLDNLLKASREACWEVSGTVPEFFRPQLLDDELAG